MFMDRKKALAMTIVLGVLLAMLAGALLPAVATQASMGVYKPVKARVHTLHESAGPTDPSWAEYRYTYGDLTYIVRFEEPVRFLREGRRVTLYANSKQPDHAMKDRPAGTNTMTLCWLVIAPVGLLFASTLINYLLIRRKEKKDANP